MRMKITEYKGYFIEKHPLFYVINLDDGPMTFRKMKEAKNWIDEQIKENDSTTNQDTGKKD